MQIDLILDPRLSATEFRDLGVFAERAGIGAVWTSSLPGARDPFVNLTALAMATTRIGVGAIAINPFDTHPGKIAAALLTLNDLAAGRAALVLGGGGEALASLGLAPQRRVTAVREAFEILTRSVAEPRQRFDYRGEVFSVAGFGCLWASSSAPQLWIGANAPQMLRMAASCAADVMMSDMPAPLAAAAVEQYRAARSSGWARFSNFVAWHVYDDAAMARREAEQWLAFRGMFRRWVCTRFMSDADYDLLESKRAEFYRAATGGPAVTGVPPHLLATLVDQLTITGSYADAAVPLEHLRQLARAGCTHVALRLYREPQRAIEFIGRTLLPALAE